jgi:hypothetical protein
MNNLEKLLFGNETAYNMGQNMGGLGRVSSPPLGLELEENNGVGMATSGSAALPPLPTAN